MTRSTSIVISIAVEGSVDEAVMRRLLTHIGALPGHVYGKNGKPWLRQRIGGYNNAAYYSPWVVLVDLDHDADCAPPIRDTWLPDPAPYMCFRVAVRAIEAWLLADREHLSDFLGIPISMIPPYPEEVDDPKYAMVELASKSRRRAIREDMVPTLGSGRKVGPAYTSRLIEFTTMVNSGWRPAVAAKGSDSLNRSLCSLCRLVEESS